MSKLGLGCWSFGGTGTDKPDDSLSVDIIRRALDMGITHLDTAQDYGAGHSETVVGQAVENVRDRAYIATKAHLADSPDEAMALVKNSLVRLGTDRLDLFYVHWPRSGVDIRPMMEGLEICRNRGWIRHIGVSNFDIALLEKAGEVCRIDVHQLGYNLLWRFPEKDILPWCRSRGIRTVAYSPIAQGLLSDRGTDLKRRSPDDPRNHTVYYRDDVWPDLKPIVEKMQDVSRSGGHTLSDLALRWVLNSPMIDRVITGAGSPEQLEAHKESLNQVGNDKDLLDQLTALSLEAGRFIPDAGNMFQYYP